MSITELLSSDRTTITVPEAASLMGADPRTVRRGIEEGKIPSIRIGRKVLILVAPFLVLLGQVRV
jgi:excisionase family DNA binding protein